MGRRKKIGVIELNESVFVSDPSYGTNTRFNCTMDIISGKYNVFITKSEGSFDKDRITNLFIIHQDFYKGNSGYKQQPKNDRENLYCYVDSGTCGIFDKNYFEKHHIENDVDNEWYDANVMANCYEDYVITDGLGVFSISGWGDGRYPIYAEYKDGKAFAIRINFL